MMNTSIMSMAKAALAMAEDGVKAARHAVKGLGTDARFFRDSKRGKYHVKVIYVKQD